VSLPAADIPDQVYELVIHKMYVNLARIFLAQKHPREASRFAEKDMQQMIEWFYQDAWDKLRQDKKDLHTVSQDAGLSDKKREVTLFLQTEYPLVGVGAPIHIFLPKVAELFGTTAIIPPHAQVANALGAIASRVMTTVQVRVKAEYQNAYCIGYSVFEDITRHFFKKYTEAETFARALAKRKVLEKSRRQGASEDPQITLDVKEWKSQDDDFGVLLETTITAVAIDHFQG
jgi:N-methylhydantoinase A/oxoprolinase/acetone carboxylase beta subunit